MAVMTGKEWHSEFLISTDTYTDGLERESFEK